MDMGEDEGVSCVEPGGVARLYGLAAERERERAVSAIRMTVRRVKGLSGPERLTIN